MQDKVVCSTNMKMAKIKELDVNEEDQGKEVYAAVTHIEMRCFLALLMFRGLQGDTKMDIVELFYGTHARPFYRACMSLNRFKFLLRCLSFHDHTTICKDYCGDLFARAHWILLKFEDNARRMYVHMEYVCINETLRNSFTRNCPYLMFLPAKPGQMGVYFFTMCPSTTQT